MIEWLYTLIKSKRLLNDLKFRITYSFTGIYSSGGGATFLRVVYFFADVDGLAFEENPIDTHADYSNIYLLTLLFFIISQNAHIYNLT